MAVRVKLHIQPDKGSPEPADPLDVIAVVNSGYEADSPEVIVPRRLAERLGFWPEPPSGSEVETYCSASGEFKAWRVPAGASVFVEGPSSASPTVQADVVISEFETEVLISDALGSELRIGIMDPKAGRWFFTTDPAKLYESEPRQSW